MKLLFQKYKSVIIFIFTFLLVYFTLSVVYKWYLDVSETGVYQPDFITYYVAKLANLVLQATGVHSKLVLQSGEAWVRLYVNNIYKVRVIEGCNAISVTVLFIAFIAAFASKVKTTLLYIITGSILIFFVNILRIALLTIWLFYYPQFNHILHGVVFPFIIYGMVFFLWVIWVSYFVKPKRNYAKPESI